MSDVFLYEDDEDAKADELPSDEEGDPNTGKSSNSNTKKPKIPPPVLGTQLLQDEPPELPRQNCQNIMVHRPNSRHIPSKTVPVSLPQLWVCSICTFAENSLLAPVCNICGSLPPMDSEQAILPQEHQHHVRTVSEQIPHKSLPNVASSILPTFLEDDNNKDEIEPTLLQRNSIANIVASNENIERNEIAMAQMIMKQTKSMSSKKELQIELYSVKMTLQRKIKLYSTRIIALKKQKSKLQTEHEIQSALWNKYYILLLRALCTAYFNKLFTLIDHRIEIEKIYLQCFEVKLEKVGIAYDKLDETIDIWDIEHMREYVQNTLCTVLNIRTSPELQSKKETVEKLKEKINKMEKKYEDKKALLNTFKVEHNKRAAKITLYLKTVIHEFNAKNKNIKLTEKYFCRADVQENFNSFLLDQRVETGRIINNWYRYLENNKTISLKDIWVFIERVVTMFCTLYNLDKTASIKYDYREYCMRFTYISVVNLQTVDQILQKVVHLQGGRKEYELLSAHAEHALFVHMLRIKYKLK